MAREVDLGTFAAAHAEGHLVIDVREGFEYVSGHVPGARLIPLGRLPQHLNEIPKDRPVYLICATGNRSLSAAAFLERAGVDAYSVAGGTGGWMAMGRRVATGQNAA